MLGFRSSAGPFRSVGHLAVTPRPYQLVPLLMALRQDTVRLLIADDVGIGKTIEASLIARELLDQGDITRTCVLCPPHLAEQWQAELMEKFHIDAQLVLASTAAALERRLPVGRTIFDEHPHVVVSIDFIKSDSRRDEFVRTCPEFVIVDEAHVCADAGSTRRHQRYELVRQLSKDPERHLVLVTATPHSGKEDPFRSLLSLISPAFAEPSRLPDGRAEPASIESISPVTSCSAAAATSAITSKPTPSSLTARKPKSPTTCPSPTSRFLARSWLTLEILDPDPRTGSTSYEGPLVVSTRPPPGGCF